MLTPFGDRLKSARKLAGMSMQDLADKVGVSKQAISKYEKNQMMPSGEILLELSKALNVSVQYFFSESKVNHAEIEVDFRKSSNLSKRSQNMIVEHALDFVERHLEITNILGYLQPFSKMTIPKTVVTNKQRAEQAANELRKAWSLGYAPILNLLDVLEKNNFIVWEMEHFAGEIGELDNFDGLSFWAEEYPVIVLNQQSEDLVRKRFTALHEVAHLLLDFSKDLTDRQKEKLCHVFSAALLLPRLAAEREFGTKRQKIAIAELVRAKLKFGISIQAIMMHLNYLDIITDSYLKGYWINVNKSGQRHEDPGPSYSKPETVTRFIALVAWALAEDLVSISKAAYLAGMSISALRNKVYLTDESNAA